MNKYKVVTAYEIKVKNKAFRVTMESLTNTIYGEPRKHIVISWQYRVNGNTYTTARAYNLRVGSYGDYGQLAEELVRSIYEEIKE